MLCFVMKVLRAIQGAAASKVRYLER